MIFFSSKDSSDSSSIIPRDSFPFSVADRDKRTGAGGVSDQLMDLLRVVSFIHDTEAARMSDPLALLQQFFSVKNIVDRVTGDLQTGDNLSPCINTYRRFQESFSRVTGSPGIVVAGVRTRKPG